MAEGCGAWPFRCARSVEDHVLAWSGWVGETITPFAAPPAVARHFDPEIIFGSGLAGCWSAAGQRQQTQRARGKQPDCGRNGGRRRSGIHFMSWAPRGWERCARLRKPPPRKRIQTPVDAHRRCGLPRSHCNRFLPRRVNCRPDCQFSDLTIFIHRHLAIHGAKDCAIARAVAPSAHPAMVGHLLGTGYRFPVIQTGGRHVQALEPGSMFTGIASSLRFPAYRQDAFYNSVTQN
jgi:hypothetical protein